MKNKIDTEYFSRNRTECLKGLLAIFVLLHHTYQKVLIGQEFAIVDLIMRSLGTYCVSGFFFISGYGLFCSYERNGSKYLEGFQKKRVLPMYLINAFLVIVYMIEKTALGFGIDKADLIKSFFYGGTVVDNGWFLLVIIVFYEIFYISAKFFKDQLCFSVLLLTIVYMVIGLSIKMPNWWYISSLSFPAGLYFSKYKKDIDNFVASKYGHAFLLVSVLFLSVFLIKYSRYIENAFILSLRFESLIQLFASLIHGLLFFILVVLIVMKICPENRILKWFSGLYLEVYVLQGLIFNILRNPYWGVNNTLLFSALSFICTLMLAMIMHPIFTSIMSSIRKS